MIIVSQFRTYVEKQEYNEPKQQKVFYLRSFQRSTREICNSDNSGNSDNQSRPRFFRLLRQKMPAKHFLCSFVFVMILRDMSETEKEEIVVEKQEPLPACCHQMEGTKCGSFWRSFFSLRNWLALFLLGTINNLSYVVVNSAGQDIIRKFNADQWIGLITWYGGS
jgi:hypothetical protein